MSSPDLTTPYDDLVLQQAIFAGYTSVVSFLSHCRDNMRALGTRTSP